MSVAVAITQGQFYEDTINLTHSDNTPIDLTGATIKSQIRRGAVSLGYTELAAFDISVTPPATSGVIVRSLSAATTASLPLPFPQDGKTTFFHDVIVTTDGGDPLQVISGPVTIAPNFSA